MKEIRAYVHNHRIADVIRALKDWGQCHIHAGPGCRNLTVIPIKSLFRSADAQEQHYSVELAEAVVNESRLDLVCEDAQVDELLGIIAHAARTGQADAGWIYVTDIVQAIPVA